jgi:hypothetical protein
MFVQMDDDSLPVIGTTNSTGDFGLIINANLGTLNSKVEQLGITNMYRVSISRVADSTNTQFGVIKYTTQSAKGFRITGIQLEAGATATSYIPTVASTVTRVDETVSKTGISSLIGQTEGTVFMEVNLRKSSITGFLIQLSDGTNKNRVQIYFLNSLFWEVTGNNLLGINGSFNFVDNSLIKIAFGYKNGDSIFYINGVEATSLGKMSANVPLSLNRIDFAKNHTNNFPINCNINKSLLFKTRLSNVELATLTTL